MLPIINEQSKVGMTGTLHWDAFPKIAEYESTRRHTMLQYTEHTAQNAFTHKTIILFEPKRTPLFPHNIHEMMRWTPPWLTQGGFYQLRELFSSGSGSGSTNTFARSSAICARTNNRLRICITTTKNIARQPTRVVTAPGPYSISSANESSKTR